MDSWWDLGEFRGFEGDQLALYRITCPFCAERGNFSVAAHLDKKKANSDKRLNFDTLRCGSCGGYVMCLWSAGSRLHDCHLLPWPIRIDSYPEHWPKDVGRFWMQAHRSLADENWDAAAVMTRSALQAALRDKGAAGDKLHREIDDLAANGLLPPIMKEWAHELRELGNDSAHPKPGQPAVEPQDAKDIARFLDLLLEYLYSLPHQIAAYRRRGAE
jgi:hypothetical protein